MLVSFISHWYLFDTIKKLTADQPIDEKKWEFLRQKMPNISGDPTDLTFNRLDKCRLSDEHLRLMDPETMTHEEFAKKYFENKD